MSADIESGDVGFHRAGTEDQCRNVQRQHQQRQQHAAAAHAQASAPRRWRRSARAAGFPAAAPASECPAPMHPDRTARPSTGASSTSGRPHSNQWASILPATSRPKGDGDKAICSSVPSRWSAANRRGRPSKVASSAATQRMPGAIFFSSTGSGPMPSGNRLVTMTKKNTAVSTSLLRRRRAACRAGPWRAGFHSTSALPPGTGSGWWLVNTAIPPAPRCSAIRSPSNFTAPTSSALKASSSTQSIAGRVSNRASSTRRFCPRKAPAPAGLRGRAAQADQGGQGGALVQRHAVQRRRQAQVFQRGQILLDRGMVSQVDQVAAKVDGGGRLAAPADFTGIGG
jgi:hypothetical protein